MSQLKLNPQTIQPLDKLIGYPIIVIMISEDLTEGVKFISIIYFMNSLFSDDFNTMNKATSDGGLTHRCVGQGYL